MQKDYALDPLGVLATLVRHVADRATTHGTFKNRLCFFLGAGADISSGGLSFSELKRRAIEEFTGYPLFDITTPERIEDRFEALFAPSRPDDRALLLEHLFRRFSDLEPSDAYKLLILLAEAGGVDAVLTTNFDVMLERAQSMLGRDIFSVFGPGLARPYPVIPAQYDLPRKPYIKLHGDLSARSVMLLTRRELEVGDYDASIMDLMTSILQTHDLVFIGYSGYDEALAQVIGDNLGERSRVYWCNPSEPDHDSPLFAHVASRASTIRIGFSDLMLAVARPILERPGLAPTEPTYLQCLFDWRMEFCNQEYVQVHGKRRGRSIVETFARRRGIESRLVAFLRSDSPLAVISGPSGHGKTTIGLQLHKSFQSDPSTRILLIRSRALVDNADLEQFVLEQLGGLGSRGPLTFFQLEKWLRHNGVRLIIFVDAVNEFSSDLARCVQFFRMMLRLCYFFPDRGSALRIVATIRQESWRSMLPQLDPAQLRRTLWVEGESGHAPTVITCGEFTDEELRDALQRLPESGRAVLREEMLTPATFAQLHDPYLLGILAEATAEGFKPTAGARVYQLTLESKIERSGSLIGDSTFKDALTAVALQGLGSRFDRFREVDLVPASLRDEIVRLSQDLGIVVRTGDGYLQFSHDRIYEYFLARGLSSLSGPSLETARDVLVFLRRFREDGRAIAAARLNFQLAARDKFHVISEALAILDLAKHRFNVDDRELLFGFARDVLMEMVVAGEALATHYLQDSINATATATLGPRQLRVIVHAIAQLPLQESIPLLARAARSPGSLASTEASIFVTHKLAREFLLSEKEHDDLLYDAPYSHFFGDPMVAPWQRLGRLLAFVGQLGPDNTHPSEYERLKRAFDNALTQLMNEVPWTDEQTAELSEFLVSSCDRLLFNATLAGIQRFFGNPRRADLAAVLDHLANGGVLSEEDIAVFEPYLQSLSSNVEYHISHFFFLLSSLNDLEGTIAFAERHYSSFNERTPPEEIDFFQAVLVYLHVFHGRSYDESRFRPLEEIILKSWVDTLLYRPGLERGERRGFADPFDRVFEDGFGVIYVYGTLLPSSRRVASRFTAYRSQLEALTESPLPMYTEYLEKFLTEQRFEEALQLLQALGTIAVIWPIEGLMAMRAAIGHHDARIRRATVRVLAEVYHRHPEETMLFLRSSGSIITDDDLMEITVRHDARIGRRQIEEEEWARILHFLLRRPGNRERLIASLRRILSAESLGQAIVATTQALGLTAETRR